MTERRPIYPAHEAQVQQVPSVEKQPWLTAPWIPLDGLAVEWANFARDYPTEAVFRAISSAFRALASERDAFTTYTQAKHVLQQHIHGPLTWRDHLYLLSHSSVVLCEAAQHWTLVVENLSEREIPEQDQMMVCAALCERLRVMTIAHAVQQELLFRYEHAFEHQPSSPYEEVRA